MRYFIGFLLTLGLVILLIVLLFGGGNDSKQSAPEQTQQGNRSLESFANTDAEASMVIAGAINADELHRQIRVTVDRTTVTYQTVQGYEGRVIEQRTFANNQAAYEAFLKALSVTGFTQGDRSAELASEQGRCPLGTRTVFSFKDASDKQLMRFWTTSCGEKSYLGNSVATTRLFQAQVPGYQNFASTVDL